MTDEPQAPVAPDDQPVDQRAPYVHDPETMGRDYRIIDDETGQPQDVRDFVGVDPEYMNHSTVAGKPILTDTERFLYTDQYAHLEGNLDRLPADEAAEAEADATPAEGAEESEGTEGEAQPASTELGPPAL